jgi:hypothetical protein
MLFFLKDVLRRFSFQQQEYVSVNNQEDLANRIQSVRHLWDDQMIRD